MEISKEELEKLKLSCLDGDEDAWKELIKILYPIAENVARHQFRLNEQTSEDLAQEVMIKFVKNLENITHISAWINRSIRNRCIDYLRKKKEILQDEDSPTHKEPSEESIDIASLEIQSILREALHLLPEKCRGLLKLRFLDELNHKDISDKLGVPYNQVPVNQARCLKKFKQLLIEKFPQFSENYSING